jgi:ribose 5-phosphate isomerase B
MKIYFGADHRGFEAKEKLLSYFTDNANDYVVVDKGSLDFDPEDDYNDSASAVAEAVLEDEGSRGVLICGSGVGMAIQANRYQGVRAAVCHSCKEVELARSHNNINILCLAADFTSKYKMKRLIRSFLETDFIRSEKYVRRNLKLDQWKEK